MKIEKTTSHDIDPKKESLLTAFTPVPVEVLEHTLLHELYENSTDLQKPISLSQNLSFKKIELQEIAHGYSYREQIVNTGTKTVPVTFPEFKISNCSKLYDPQAPTLGILNYSLSGAEHIAAAAQCMRANGNKAPNIVFIAGKLGESLCEAKNEISDRIFARYGAMMSSDFSFYCGELPEIIAIDCLSIGSSPSMELKNKLSNKKVSLVNSFHAEELFADKANVHEFLKNLEKPIANYKMYEKSE